jgi:uncharacterized protein (DUF433 family)
MAVQQLSEYVRRDEHDRLLVGNTRVTLESVVYPFDRGESPEGIARSYRALSLEQVYGAIAYYLGHQEEVRVYLKQSEVEWDRLRAEIDKNPSPVVERLRGILRKRRDAEAAK